MIATGVEYIIDGTNTTTVVHATKEVILSAGKAFYEMKFMIDPISFTYAVRESHDPPDS